MPSERATQEAGQCPACDSESFWVVSQGSDRFFRRTFETFRLVECSICGLVRLDPIPAGLQLQELAPEARWWESVKKFEADRFHLLRTIATKGEMRFIRDAMHGANLVLDLSGEHATHIGNLRHQGLAVETVDITNLQEEAARARRSGSPDGSYAPHTSFSPRSFDAIVALHVLEHCRDPRSVLVTLRDLLGDDGSLVVQVPDAASWEALFLAERWIGFDIPRHPISFRERDLQSLLESSGFEILRLKRFSLAYGVTGLATSLCPGLDPTVRRRRRARENRFTKILRDFLYGALVMGALPIMLLAAASGSGSTIMIEARKAGAEAKSG